VQDMQCVSREQREVGWHRTATSSSEMILPMPLGRRKLLKYPVLTCTSKCECVCVSVCVYVCVSVCECECVRE
jgi:hypothetical protein